MKNSIFLAALGLLVPTLAQAHPGHGPATGLFHGLSHIISGLDPIYATVAMVFSITFGIGFGLLMRKTARR